MNALCEGMVLRHPLNRQILKRDQIEPPDDAATVLVGEVAPTSCNTLIHAGDDFAPLGFGKGMLLSTKEPRIGDHITCCKSGKHFQTDINTHLFTSCWQRRWFDAVAGKTRVPFSGTAAANCRRLRSAV
jgi:hypothetical protein